MSPIQAAQSQASPRSHRWISASHRVARTVDPRVRASLVSTIQALGWLDEELAAIDARYVAGEGYIDEAKGILAFNAHLTQSYLWVLGTYEVVRILRARARDEGNSDDQLEWLYGNFTRLRIPLAKFEPAGKHRETDGHVAYPALNSAYGVAWQVAEDTFIARGELSDYLLAYLESQPAVARD